MYIIDGIAYAGDPILPPESPRLCGVRAMKNHLLWTRFDNGQQRIFDCKPLLRDGTVFEPLKDPDVFRDVYIDFFAPTWLDGTVDIAPDTIYETGTNPEEENIL
ncbi:MAG: DUF2442 domain-containing protein [Oscillospiraceae bacterium]|nr:DUF2442 domain-containing protein [Oscillospiraceae bacterium]